MQHRTARAGLALAAGLLCACASNPPARSVSSSRIAPDVLAARLADADALAARGCYLCLRDAADAYTRLLPLSDSPDVVRKTLENDLMIAIREVELRLPDSGAAQRARGLQERVGGDYAAYFEALEYVRAPLQVGGVTFAEFRRQEADRKALADRLERDWPSSAASAYFYIATAIGAGQLGGLRPQISAILDTYPDNLAVRYRLQLFSADVSEDVANDLLSREPRFGEVRLILGQRNLFGAELVAAHGELTKAHDLLPDSLVISLALGRVELAFGRYQEALVLFSQVLDREPDESAQLGQAVALSYLKRSREAIDVLVDLLKHPERSPGDKYYWRAWNYLQLGEPQPAYDDATAALKAMAGADVYKLAGIASYDLGHIVEARGYFESALRMNGGECDSLRFLGLIDSAERNWQPAFTRFTTAAGCYRQLIDRLSADLTEKKQDTSGLFAGQIASLTTDIAEATSMLQVSTRNAEIASRNAAMTDTPANRLR